jgi:hypothetical protein
MDLRPLDKLRPEDHEAIKLAELRYPWAVVHEQTEIKPQTVKKKLTKIWANRLWSELKTRLLKEFAELDEENFKWLEEVLYAEAHGERAFRRMGQMISEEWRGRTWEKTTPRV